MKRYGIVCILLLMNVSLLHAQTRDTDSAETRLPAVDLSPMDMSYYPEDYPMLKVQEKVTQPPVARVIYSRPHLNGRVILGGLVEYGKIWRMGANESTEIEFFRDVTIGGKKIPKGRYTLYALVNPKDWTIIINKDTDTWGAFRYDEKKDVVHVNVPVQQSAVYAEALSIDFVKSVSGCNMELVWDKVKIVMPIAFK